MQAIQWEKAVEKQYVFLIRPENKNCWKECFGHNFSSSKFWGKKRSALFGVCTKSFCVPLMSLFAAIINSKQLFRFCGNQFINRSKFYHLWMKRQMLGFSKIRCYSSLFEIGVGNFEKKETASYISDYNVWNTNQI